jgi:hypothetical protein
VAVAVLVKRERQARHKETVMAATAAMDFPAPSPEQLLIMLAAVAVCAPKIALTAVRVVRVAAAKALTTDMALTTLQALLTLVAVAVVLTVDPLAVLVL